jgi:zinc protease
LYTNDGMAESYDYYATQTFMKMRSTNIRKMDEETVETTTNFSDYKEVDGFKFAHAFSMSVGKMTLNGVVKSISVNPKLVITEDF